MAREESRLGGSPGVTATPPVATAPLHHVTYSSLPASALAPPPGSRDPARPAEGRARFSPSAGRIAGRSGLRRSTAGPGGGRSPREGKLWEGTAGTQCTRRQLTAKYWLCHRRSHISALLFLFTLLHIFKLKGNNYPVGLLVQKRCSGRPGAAVFSPFPSWNLSVQGGGETE